MTSIFQNLFGRKKQSPPVPSTMDIISELKDKMNLIEKRNIFLENKIVHCICDAKLKHQNGNKSGALFELQRKKTYEEEIKKNVGILLTLDNQIHALESACMNQEILKAMKSGITTIKHEQSKFDSNMMDDLALDLEEQKNINSEINRVLSQPAEQLLDDDELLNELNELNDEGDISQSVVLPNPIANPIKLPTLKSTPVMTEDEIALEQLCSSMNLNTPIMN
jgi:charged multivesicular body protein 4